MNKRRVTLIFICLCFIFVIITTAEEECDKSKCPGPLSFYEDVECKPIKKNPEDCCAFKYDCSHLNKKKLISKCYVNDNVYEIGESLKSVDALPCDIGCVCRKRLQGNTASLECLIVDCFPPPPKPGCYRKTSPLHCCSAEDVCPKKPEDRATCLVDGKIYKDGEYFQPKDAPRARCTCQPGYKGKNVEPFCFKGNNYCRNLTMRHYIYEIHNKCAPVYNSKQSPQTSCSLFYRCQNKNDTLISHTNDIETDKTNTCKFGTIEMQIGDELKQATDYSSVCVKCVCEVPPTPTCQRLPDDKCDKTVNSTF